MQDRFICHIWNNGATGLNQLIELPFIGNFSVKEYGYLVSAIGILHKGH